MDPVTLYPIYDLDNNLLVPEGVTLTDSFMAELCRKNMAQYDEIPLLQYKTVEKDLLGQFTIPPYDAVFGDGEIISSVLSALERITLPEPVLRSLDYFRENDYHTYRHMLIITALSTLILQNLPSKHADAGDLISQVGPTHDIGKIAVPTDILLKKTPLTQEELSKLKHHTVAGYVLLSYYYKNHTAHTPQVALNHHERLNESGYPRGIRQEDLLTEITTICDIYDALIAKRPYRPISYDNRTALEELTWMAERGEFGIECVRILVMFNRAKKTSLEDCAISMERRGKAPEDNVYGKTA